MRAVVVGAGAAGLLCAGMLAHSGVEVRVIERNEKAGKKLYITGKGRCNLTNDCDVRTWLDATVCGAKFLYSAAYSFPPSATKEFFSDLGLRLKTERGGRVFPASDKSSDVIKALTGYCGSGGVDFLFGRRVDGLVAKDGKAVGVRCGDDIYRADAVVVATGGVTYPSTGSTGDGYEFANSVGVNVVAPKPTLVPLKARGIDGLAGLALKNVVFSIIIEGKERASAFGEMNFTKSGVGGPIVLQCSSFTAGSRGTSGEYPPGTQGAIDFKPALDEATLDARLVRELAACPTAAIDAVAARLLPRTIVKRVLASSGVDARSRAADVSKEQRKKLVAVLKHWTFPLTGAEGAEQAVVTSGGVDVSELDPRTMRCKKVEGLYFVGETIDVDSLTGGFNLQNAWATAAAAARAIVKSASNVRP